MTSVKVYTSGYCAFCQAAKNFLDDKGIPYEEIYISSPQEKAELYKKTGHMSVPQIFINDEMIGGFQDLQRLDLSGELEKKLAS
jgi:glutaredoxin 3